MKNGLKAALMLSIFILGFSGFEVRARDVNITPDMPFVDIQIGGKTIRIERIQDTKHKLVNSYALTSRKCPPFCVHPMQAAAGVVTVGEVELIKFIKNEVEKQTGLLIDARIPAFYKKGTIPGAVNIPFNLFADDRNPYLDRILTVLGGVKNSDDEWDFSKAMKLLLFCNGPWCDQSPRAIRNLIAAGYPPEKIFYYRGGMQNWQNLGLTVVVP